MPFPTIDPVLIQLGPFAIRWYALAYIVGIVLGGLYIGFLNKRPPHYAGLRPLDDMMLWAILGIICGGRLGYVLFYNLPYYSEHITEIFQLWHGGMSFHGGLIGFIVAMYMFSHRHRFPFLGIMDLCACAAPIGLFFGRLANFINGELYGRMTTVPWGIIFPNGGEIPRHPSQVYEAILEGLLLFVLISSLAFFTTARTKQGLLSGVFLCGYALLRIFIEQFREPDEQIGFLWGMVTMGQLLCIPMLLLGLFLVLKPLFRASPPHA